MSQNKLKVLFMGRKPVAAMCLQWLVARDDVELVGVLTDSHLSVSPTTEVAEANGLNLYTFDEALELINSQKLTFDLGVSMLFWRVLKDGFISTPELGVINFHPAPLPEFKGTAGYNLAILEELEEWRVTAHYVDKSVDTGPIIDSLVLPIEEETETAKSLEARCQPLLFDLFELVVGQTLQSRKRLMATPNVGGRYVSRNEMEAMKEVKPGDDVSRKIRAFWFPPYDGAFQVINGVKCTLVDRFVLRQLVDGENSSLFTDPANR